MSLERSNLFRMNGNARAETVAKQLKKLLAEIGRQPKLSFCREAVARMYGYTDWSSLCAASFEEQSPDDADVAEHERSARHDHQRAVLVKMGLAEEAAANIRNRLSPTGRSSEDVADHLPIAIQQTLQYHPERFMEALDDTARMKFELARYRANGVPGKRTTKRMPEYTFDQLHEEVAKWAERDSMLPLDRKQLLNAFPPLVMFQGSAQSARHGGSTVLDVSSIVADLAKRDVTGDVYSGQFSKSAGDYVSMYVHFGINTFPSPWPACGFEGCYVTVLHPVDDCGTEVTLQLVVSPETTGDQGFGEDMFEGPNYHHFVMNIRHLRITATSNGPSDDVALGNLGKTVEGFEHWKLDRSAWSRLLRAPINAAWNAVKAYQDRTLPLVDGLLCDVPKKSFVKLARARTEDQRQRVVDEIAEEGEMVVRFLGGVPESALHGEELVPQLDPSLSPIEDKAVWAEGYLRMARDAFPEMRLVLARRAATFSSDYAQPDGNSTVRAAGDEYTDADRHGYNRVQAAVLEQDALSQLGRWSEALAAAMACPHVPKAGWGVDYRLSALVARAGTAADAENLLRRYAADTSTPSDWPIIPWCRALLAARFGTESERDAAIAKAVEVDPDVLPRLLGTDREEWYDRAMIQYVERTEFNLWPFLVSGMLRDGWEAVPNWRSVLSAAVGDHDVRRARRA